MYLQFWVEDGPDPSLSWILQKNPANAFRRDVGAHGTGTGRREVVGSFLDDGSYHLEVRQDVASALALMRQQNAPNYVSAGFHAVTVAAMRGIGVALKSALLGNRGNGGEISEEEFWRPRRMGARIGPFPRGRERAIQVFAEAQIRATCEPLGEDAERVERAFGLSLVTEGQMSVTEFLRRVLVIGQYLGEAFRVDDRLHRHVDDDRIVSLAKLSAGWIDGMPSRAHILKVLAPRQWGQLGALIDDRAERARAHRQALGAEGAEVGDQEVGGEEVGGEEVVGGEEAERHGSFDEIGESERGGGDEDDDEGAAQDSIDSIDSEVNLSSGSDPIAAIDGGGSVAPDSPSEASLESSSGGSPSPGDSSGGAPRRLHLQRHDLICQILVDAMGASSKVLDLGSGGGQLAVAIGRALPTAEVLGVEASDAGIARSRQRAQRSFSRPTRSEEDAGAPRERYRRVHFSQQNLLLLELPERWEHPDAVVLSEVIEHFEALDRRDLIDFVAHVIAPRLIVITTPNVAWNAVVGMSPGQMRHDDHRIEFDRVGLEAEVIGRLSQAYDVQVVDLIPGEQVQPSFVVRATRRLGVFDVETRVGTDPSAPFALARGLDPRSDLSAEPRANLAARVGADPDVALGGVGVDRYAEGDVQSLRDALRNATPAEAASSSAGVAGPRQRSDRRSSRSDRRSASRGSAGHDQVSEWRVAELRGRPGRVLSRVRIDDVNEEIFARTMRAGSVKRGFVENARDIFYLAPTVAPAEHSAEFPRHLEHPASAIEYFRARGIRRLIGQTKYMGSRAHLLFLRDPDMARRLGVSGPAVAISRTGLPFFGRRSDRKADLARIYAEVQPRMKSDVLILDAEVLPWRYKSGSLIYEQFRIPGEVALLDRRERDRAEARRAVPALGSGATHAAERAERFLDALRPFEAGGPIEVRPFHVLATGNFDARGRLPQIEVGLYHPHDWHMARIEELAADPASGSSAMRACDHHWIDAEDPASVRSSIERWEAHCAAGGEGFVYKPHLVGQGMLARGTNGRPIQPAVKVRGPEYLRMIYGIDYDDPAIFQTLTRRRVAPKRALATLEASLAERILLALLHGAQEARLQYAAAFLGVEWARGAAIDQTL